MSVYKRLGIMFTALAAFLVPKLAFAEPVDYTDFSSVITSMTTQVSVSSVVGVLAQAATVSIGLVFMWWGVRKVSQMLFSAFRKGKLRA